VCQDDRGFHERWGADANHISFEDSIDEIHRT
jgi:hypothetical protein